MGMRTCFLTFLISITVDASFFYNGVRCCNKRYGSLNVDDTTKTITTTVDGSNNNDNHPFSCSINKLLTKENGNSIVTNEILPDREYGTRIQFGRDAQGLSASTIVKADDPRL